MAKRWIQGAIKHPGALHRQLGIAAGKKIPLTRLRSAANSDDETLARRARLAMTLRKMNPWEVMHDEKGYWVVKKDTNEKVHNKPHKTRAEAVQHVRALYAAEGIPNNDPGNPKNKFKRRSHSQSVKY